MVQKAEIATQSKVDEYFQQNEKFFNTGDTNAKRAFFYLGQYTRRVSEIEEKQIAENGAESKFQAKLAKLIGYNMSYRAFTIIMKLLDTQALKCNSQLFYKCSGVCKELMINSDLVSNKKALSVEDGNMAFSLGMYQKF
ncbi:hypothetical protein [Methanosarcina mazei]|uniref:Uncharacterized protein n=1 Tax=Methanosarcina mazei TaxID=2209 RepID=A0A0F8NRM0_METMZ|nr:hypothetical protein [Methanosarcina mazei]KKH38981.1 hypothetical protein DU71_01355 [Methanosarcina mazei]KKH43585.1 hypothetical protein DU72_00025 [Methanosarcina mazei]QIB91268.1 hypothetical protein FQU78_09655 [Methanosarcina mazei]